MPDSKKKKQSTDTEREMWLKFCKTNVYLLLVKTKTLSSSETRPKIQEAIKACFEDYKKKEEEIKKLK